MRSKTILGKLAASRSSSALAGPELQLRAAYVLAAERPLSASLLVEACESLRPLTLNTVPYIVEGLCAKLRDGDGAARATLGRLALVTYGGAGLPSHCAPTPLASTPSRLQTHARSSTAAGSPVKLRAAVAAR